MDIVTDTLHASSSDLMTWITLAMIRMYINDHLPQQWLEISAAALPIWEERDRQEPFLSDNRRGYVRISPIGLTSTGKPEQPAGQVSICVAWDSLLEMRVAHTSRPTYGPIGLEGRHNECRLMRTLRALAQVLE